MSKKKVKEAVELQELDIVMYDDRDDGRDYYAPKVARVIIIEGDQIVLRLEGGRLVVARRAVCKPVNV
jgi:hypothetical protein